MLEGLVQASAWLARATLDFAPALVVLQEARNVTFKSFLAPGQVLRLESQCQEMTPERSLYTASGQVGDREVVKARLALRHLSLADTDESQRSVDERIRRELRALFGLLWIERAAVQG
jgi:acyl dehydratase